MNLEEHILFDLKSKDKTKIINLFLTKRNIKKLSRHSKKYNITQSKFLEYFLYNINKESLDELNKEIVYIKKCVKTKRTVKVETIKKIKNIVLKEDITLTTLINRLIEKHL